MVPHLDSMSSTEGRTALTCPFKSTQVLFEGTPGTVSGVAFHAGGDLVKCFTHTFKVYVATVDHEKML